MSLNKDLSYPKTNPILEAIPFTALTVNLEYLNGTVDVANCLHHFREGLPLLSLSIFLAPLYTPLMEVDVALGILLSCVILRIVKDVNFTKAVRFVKDSIFPLVVSVGPHRIEETRWLFSCVSFMGNTLELMRITSPLGTVTYALDSLDKGTGKDGVVVVVVPKVWLVL